MESFTGRERELSLLDDIYHRERIRTCAVYGRRGIGKTSLLRRFSEGRRTLFVRFTGQS
ncbi:MAG: ATP-binding protein [Candidatus Methanomethylophilaceae archaeon]|nr:ATP-binding protein [Candidatus Methanomethylophilaceae archaeon]